MNPLNDQEKYPRQEPSIPWEVSREVLTNPKAKNSGSFRRTMLRSRERAIGIPARAPKTYAERVNEFVKSRGMTQLCCCLRRYPRHVRSMTNWLNRHPVEGMNFLQLQQRNTVEMSLADTQKHLVACESEYSRRTTHRA